MTLQQLEYIVALDNFRHFVKAAEYCFVTQPTLTMQVQKLEEEMGMKIFDRSRKPLKPTLAGEQVLIKARQIVREVEQLKALVHDEVELMEGTFTLGVIPTLSPYLVPLFIAEFTRANPKTHLRIKEMQTADIIHHLKQGTIDLGLLVTPLEERVIREVPIFYEPFLLYLPEGHALQGEIKIIADDLDPQEVLVLEEGHCFREQALAVCSSRGEGMPLGFEYQSGSIEALKALVDRGIGYTLVPELSVINDLGSSQIRRFFEEPVREVSIVVHNSFTKEALLERLRDKIQDAVPEDFTKKKKYVRVKWR